MMLRIENLSITGKEFQLRVPLMEIPVGSYATLVGTTGSGKTTLLETICGLRPAAGSMIQWQGRDIGKLPPEDRGLGYVPQDAALFPGMKVLDQLTFGLQIRRVPRWDVRQRIMELTEGLNLQDLLQRKVETLSGGERQKVALGRALAFRPPLLCLDEPFSALDEGSRRPLLQLLQDVNAGGTTILHVTHHPQEVQRVATDRWAIQDGQLCKVKNQVLNDAEG